MNLLRWKVIRFLGLAPSPNESAPVRMHIRNPTRETVLADSLEVAGQGSSRRKGLLGRDRLNAGEGLWIIPCEAVHTFGMRFPIDLIYLDRKHRIIKTRSHVRPGRLSACLAAHSVLELPSGTVRNTQTMRGDTLEIISGMTAKDHDLPAR